MMRRTMSPPTMRELAHAVKLAGLIAGTERATYRAGAVSLRLAAGWSLTISPDDAGRFRLDARYYGRIRASMWCLAGDDARLAELAASAGREAASLVA